MKTIEDYRLLNSQCKRVVEEGTKITEELIEEWYMPEMGVMIYKNQGTWAMIYLEVLGYNNFKHSIRLINRFKLLNKKLRYEIEYDKPENMVDNARDYAQRFIDIMKIKDDIILKVKNDSFEEEDYDVEFENIKVNDYHKLNGYEQRLEELFELFKNDVEEDWNLEFYERDIKKLELEYFIKYNDILQTSDELKDIAEYLDNGFNILMNKKYKMKEKIDKLEKIIK